MLAKLKRCPETFRAASTARAPSLSVAEFRGAAAFAAVDSY